MGGRFWTRFGSVLLWRYRRGAWQYDVIVALILAFIFLSPKSLFNDRPSEPVVREIEIGVAADGVRVFWVETNGLKGTVPDTPDNQLQELVRDRSGPDLNIVKTETVRDEAGSVRGYLIYHRP